MTTTYSIDFSTITYSVCLAAFIATLDVILRSYVDASTRAFTPGYYPEGW